MFIEGAVKLTALPQFFRTIYMSTKEFWNQIKEKLWENISGPPSYWVVSCGGTPLKIVKQYIEDQRRPPKQRQIERSKCFAGRKRSPKEKWKWEERR
jgi:putative transposase